MRSKLFLRAVTWIRFGRLLALVLWIGGIAFFAFVVAPVAFGKLPTAHEAGLVVGATLRVLHLLGLVCGGIFLLLTLADVRRMASRGLLLLECALVMVMATLTAYSQFVVLPAMEVYRLREGGDVAAADVESPSRAGFERLHKVSEDMEGAVLFCGFGLLLCVAAEPGALTQQRRIAGKVESKRDGNRF